MTVSRDMVIDAYRFMLKREPENEAVIAKYQGVDDWRELRDLFETSQEFLTTSREFRGAADDGIVDHHVFSKYVGRYLDEQDTQTDLLCSDQELQMMFDRVSDNWKQFGETEPFWSVLVNPIYKRSTIQQHLASFYESGLHGIERSLNFLRRNGVKADGFDRALDFGCGVGRLTVALAPYAKAVVGADVSPGHLTEARESAKQYGVRNAEFVQISAMEDIDKLGKFDFITSFIVLQHNPPPVMGAIYRKLLSALNPGGVAVIQMPTYIAGQRFVVADYLSGENIAMEMNALPQYEIFRIIESEGCRALEVREDLSIGDVPPGISQVFAVLRPAS